MAGHSGAWHGLAAALFLLYAFPIVFLLPEVAIPAMDLVMGMTPDGPVPWAALAAVTASLAGGALLLQGASRLLWILFLLCCGLALGQAAVLRHRWEFWIGQHSDREIAFFGYAVLALLLVPLQAALLRVSPGPAGHWMRLGMRTAFGLQIAACMGQFLVWKTGSGWLAGFLPDGIPLLRVRHEGRILMETLRLSGTLVNPNYLAAMLLLSWPFFLRLPGDDRRDAGGREAGWLAVCVRRVCLAAAPLAVGFTYSRAGYLGLLAQLALLGWLVWRRGLDGAGWRAAGKEAAALGGGLLLALALVPRLTDRMGQTVNLADASLGNRVRVWKIWGRLFAEQPLDGWGPGVFATLYNHFHKLPGISFPFADVHSTVLNFLFSLGVCGSALGILALTGGRPVQALRHAPVAALTALAGVLFPLVSDNPVLHPSVAVALLWVLALVAAGRPCLPEPDPPSRRLIYAAAFLFSAYVFGLFL